MVIRYMNIEGVYFSLNDVAALLGDEGVLTKNQLVTFKRHCQAYMSRELAKAYKSRAVNDHLQPIILPFCDYFIHCVVWENLIGLLPKTAAYQRKVNYLTFMLSEPDSIYRYPATFHAVDLICMTRPASQAFATLPGPLVLEKRDN